MLLENLWKLPLINTDLLIIDYDAMMQGLADLHIPEEARIGLAADIMSSFSEGLAEGKDAFMSFTD